MPLPRRGRRRRRRWRSSEAAARTEKPNHDETTIKLTSIKVGNYYGQQTPAQTAHEKQNQRKPVQNDQKKKERQFKTQRRKRERIQNEIRRLSPYFHL
jgi:hypothetical protein